MNLPAEGDTIAAVATPPGRGGIGIIRLSGPAAFAISQEITSLSPKPRVAALASFRDGEGELLDEGLLLHFPAPHSFTGEDVVELHCHGGPFVLAAIIRRCIQCGARNAAPGEFSQRAFLNDKIDLFQAEAIADLIASGSDAAARSASRSLSGDFSHKVQDLLESLTSLRIFVEAAIDFPEEEVDFIGESDVIERLDALDGAIDGLLAGARRGRRLRDGMKLVLAGAPNAGKSSLLNRLAEQDSAIVTEIPGTTRDVLREYIDIDGMPLHIVDTAGLREAADAVEREGIRRAQAELESADQILLIVDASDSGHGEDDQLDLERFARQLPKDTPLTLVRNKIDRIGESARIETSSATGVVARVSLSALTGEGLDLLRHHLLALAGLDGSAGSDFSARERHVLALEQTHEALREARRVLLELNAPELLAEHLREAQEALGSITGRLSSDELLGKIFSSFCIGK
ncbi:MAG: tRNA uridine-5-carboxymethylaminomethyl(34) synthesis GTPase MnmE [Halieaceae bacterium]|jgi:tRNA modification GTPase|nr:tRNA uridine-5-carboxymethylaminomethyl(34) synthesis GTPase MnmE [Halieaceae bacterium]